MADLKILLSDIASKNDQGAFRQLFDYYFPRLTRFAGSFLLSESIAEEAVADVFVKLWRNRQHIPEIQNIDIYLYKSVRNQCLSYIKKRKLDTIQLSESHENSFEWVNPESSLIQQELIDTLENIICSLPTSCQLVFRMVRDEGLKYEEAANILGLSKSTVKNHMNSALKKIRIRLSSYFDGDI